MACTYELEGRKFNSELELDDFLLSRYKFKSSVGDIVFQKNFSSKALATYDTLIAKSRESEALKKLMRRYKREGKIWYDEDGNMISSDLSPYIGVTKILNDMSRKRETPFFPYFDDENYWNEKFNLWRIGTFSDEDIKLLFDGDEQQIPESITIEDLKKYKKEYVKKWDSQAAIGTAIHTIPQMFFSSIENGIVGDMQDSEIIEYMMNHMEESNKKYLLNSDVTILKEKLRNGIKMMKELRSSLENRFGKDLIYLPEIAVSAPIDNSIESTNTVLGIIDLLVIDSKGNCHILDFKTSIKDYIEFAGPKRRTYQHQLGLYGRILNRFRLNTYGTRYLIMPIKIEGFKKDDKDEWNFDTISSRDSKAGIFDDITDEIINPEGSIKSNLDEIIHEAAIPVILTGDEVLQNVKNIMQKCFPYGSSRLDRTKEEIAEEIKKYSKTLENGNISYKFYGGSKEFIAVNESELVDKVYQFFKDAPIRQGKLVARIKDCLLTGIQQGIDDVNAIKLQEQGVDPNWFQHHILKYCNSNYEVQDYDTLEQLGIITLFNKTTDSYSFIKVSSNDIYRKLYESKRALDNQGNSIKGVKNIAAGVGVSDSSENSKSGSLIIDSLYGNIELMETMFAINFTNSLSDQNVSRLEVINPYLGQASVVSNEELLYSYNLLTDKVDVGTNLISEGSIRFSSQYQLACEEFNDIMHLSELDSNPEYAKFVDFKPCTVKLEAAKDGRIEEKIDAITDLIKKLENTFSKTLKDRVLPDYESKEAQLYNQLLITLADLKGLHFRQQTEDHRNAFNKNWWDKGFQGISGNYIDNPGNLSSETLNSIAKVLFQAYQNTRDVVYRKREKLKILLDNLKRDKQFSTLKESTYGNQNELYSDMIEVRNGDLYFKRPEEMQLNSEREFLEFVLTEINNNRFSNTSEEEMNKLKENRSSKYYRIPLTAASGLEQYGVEGGFFGVVKEYFRRLDPRVSFEHMQNKLEGLGHSEASTIIWKMTNMFDKGESDQRDTLLKKNSLEYFERNLEVLTLKHLTAYSLEENVDEIFPLMKAAMIHIQQSGHNVNTNFKEDIHYLEQFIKSKVFNQSIISKELRIPAEVMNKVRSAASLLTLGFSPSQGPYQALQGFWFDIKTAFAKMGFDEGRNPFGFSHLEKAAKLAYGDLFKPSEELTVLSGLNMIYGLNDMDMNNYGELISSNRHGIYHIGRLAFKTATRPDYYNRGKLFMSKMDADGCLDAHKIENGKFIYDCKEDKRYKAYLLNPLGTSKDVLEAKARYIAAAKQFIKEGTRDENGELFKLDLKNPKDLPRAYTTLEAESMKSLADEIYGYYTHERKSLVQATFLGGLWLQMKTFWSAKKNQYLAEGGIKLQGEFKQVEIDGVKQCWALNENGELTDDLVPEGSKQSSGVPAVQWTGKWQEGIIVTLNDLFTNVADQRSIIKGVQKHLNEIDPQLREAYIQNYRKLASDLFLWGFGGALLCGTVFTPWIQREIKDNKKHHDFINGLEVSALNVLNISLRNSFADFNFAESIGSPVWDWQPFAFSLGSSRMKTWWNVAMGDEDFYDGVVNTFTVTKQTKPLFDSLKPDYFRTDREK